MAQAMDSKHEDIISEALGRAPDLQLGHDHGRWRLGRWRQCVGGYTLPALPDPMFVMHVLGRPDVCNGKRDGSRDASPFPDCVRIVPSGRATAWLADGELDLVTLRVASAALQRAPAHDQIRRMSFAFSNPLGAALARQVLSEIYAPETRERDCYVGVLVDALRAHMFRNPFRAGRAEKPPLPLSAHRVRKMMNAVLEHPAGRHDQEGMAANAGVAPAHFTRAFRQLAGEAPGDFSKRPPETMQ